ncbi:SusC/RagA family TonB-linked outer membrane protein [Parafilimonas sp.]|uniref:SusC/RagA family TonB-linked outer membrane protein n=1 Tax=Parafilimonas sp. TaxID=1969739 RepID=UPI0039E21471
MKKFSLILTVWLSFSSIAHLYAQVNSQINSLLDGVIIDSATQAPLQGAVVNIKGTKHNVITDKNGTFNFKTGQKFPYTLVISYAGYISRELEVDGSPVKIFLKESAGQLNDVIITGYSTQQRRYVASSITSVSGNVVQNQTAAGFNQLLQGKAAGVQVIANNGVPGGGITFRIRGNNSINASVEPLYIVDGVFLSNTDPVSTFGNQSGSNPLATINASDIESITVLKDANATAIYGSLGANGVVIITTKRGRDNAPAQINFDAWHGFSTAVKKFVVTNGPETALLKNEAKINTALDNGQDTTNLSGLIADPESQPTYDRISDIFRTALSENYNLSAQGGAASSDYYVALGYLNQQSVVKPSNYVRYSARLNYDNNITAKLKVGTSINISRSDRKLSGSDNNPKGVINSALFVPSYQPIYNDDGTYARYGSFDNHIALIKNLNDKSVEWRTIGNLFAEYSFTPALKLRSSWSIDNIGETENNYSNTNISAGISTNGSASASNDQNTVYTNEQVLTYIKNFGEGNKNNINALVGNTLNTVKTQSVSASGTGFATNNITSISSAATTSGSASSSTAKLVSFFGKASYAYDGKYIVDASIRADGSSKFGKNKQWGYFPSGGIAWRAGQESFIKDLHIFDDLKFRGSIGLSGNQNGIGAYAALGLWSSGTNYLEEAGTAPSQLANPDLTWETTRQLDVGTEFAILKNKLTVSFDYYNKYTYNLLLDVPVPSRSGFTSYLQNYGAVRNKGFELSVHSENINTKDFNWSTDFNISWNKNRIEKLSSDITQGASGRNISILSKGYAVNSFYLYKQLYVDSQTGNAVYEDINQDGKITSADRHIVGNALPHYSGGLTNTLTYKNFDFNFFFYFQQGNKIMNMNDFFLVHGGTQANIGFVPRQLKRWQKAGDVTDIPHLTTYSGDADENGGAANNYGGNVASLSSRYLEDGSFIRLKNISLGYSLPFKEGRSVFTKVRIYVQATNLVTFTNYGGLDPEVNSQSSSQSTTGYDWATVPQAKTFQVGVNVTF